MKYLYQAAIFGGYFFQKIDVWENDHIQNQFHLEICPLKQNIHEMSRPPPSKWKEMQF